jgi:hypothetical protein
LHALEPTSAWNVPRAQGEQVVELAVIENDPATHEVHSLAELAEYLPTAQPPVTADSPDEAQNAPARHEVHALDPIKPW